MAYIRDRRGNQFCTRLSNVFVLGKAGQPLISLPKAAGLRLSIHEKAARKAAHLKH